jgi:hypothetical protein
MAKHEFTAKVVRLYVLRGGTKIRLDLPAAEQPKDGYFTLPLTHDNYNALYSLALTSAINGYQMRIRTTTDIDPGEPAEVLYTVVDWPAHPGSG